MNDLPAFSDFARALESRLLMLSFVHSYVGKEDRSLKYRLKVDAAAGKLVMFALKGLKRLRAKGQFTEPVSSKELLTGYRDVSVPTFAFANECLEIEPNPEKWGPGMWVETGQLYDVWAGWCKERSQKAGSRAQFCRWFVQAFPTLTTERRRLQTERFYGYAGVTVRPSALQRYVRERR
jgi:phage/plasmid-associated DNA primase